MKDGNGICWRPSRVAAMTRFSAHSPLELLQIRAVLGQYPQAPAVWGAPVQVEAQVVWLATWGRCRCGLKHRMQIVDAQVGPRLRTQTQTQHGDISQHSGLYPNRLANKQNTLTRGGIRLGVTVGQSESEQGVDLSLITGSIWIVSADFYPAYLIQTITEGWQNKSLPLLSNTLLIDWIRFILLIFRGCHLKQVVLWKYH